MKDELVIESLIELYKERGIDLHILLDDPMFQSLKLDTKVSLIKKYASHISSSTSRSLSKSDIRTLVENTAVMSGLGALSSASGNIAFNISAGKSPYSISPKSMLIAAGLGAVLGAGKTIMDASNSIAQRRDMDKNVSSLISSGSDKDAIKILALRSLQSGKVNNTGSTTSILRSTGNNLSEAIPGIGMTIGEGYGRHQSYKAYSKIDPVQDYLDNHQSSGMTPEEYMRNDQMVSEGHTQYLSSSKNAILEKLKGII